MSFGERARRYLISFRNLITSEDLHPPKNVEAETLPANIHTIDEAEEEEEEEEEGHPSKLSVRIFQSRSISIYFFRPMKRSLHF